MSIRANGKTAEKFPALHKEIAVDKEKAAANKFLEKQTFLLMTSIYCDEHRHGGHIPVSEIQGDTEITAWIRRAPRVRRLTVCAECKQMIEEVFRHTERCPHSMYKTFCHQCPSSCYSSEWLERIIPVMSCAGPKLVLRHPYLSLKFAGNLLAAKRLIKRYQNNNFSF